MPKQTDTPYKSSPMAKESPGDDTIIDNRPGEDTKKARSMNKDAGRGSNAAGTGQRVEDDKNAKH